MGASLCSLRQPSAEKLLADGNRNSPRLQPKASLINRILMSSCFKSKKRKPMQKVAKTRSENRMSLGEWLMTPPAVEKRDVDVISPSKIPRHLNDRDCAYKNSPSSLVAINARFSSLAARDSSLLEVDSISPNKNPGQLDDGVSPSWMNSPSSFIEISSQISSLARDSFSLERPKKSEESSETGEAPREDQSQSGRLEKKVSFRLPHIIILYSPDAGGEEDNEKYNSEPLPQHLPTNSPSPTSRRRSF